VHPEQVDAGSWDSTHIFEVLPKQKIAEYKLTTTVMLHLVNPETAQNPKIELGGSLTRQVLYFHVGRI
jgi:capping protein beta